MRSFGGKNFSLKPIKSFYFLNKFRSENGGVGSRPPDPPPGSATEIHAENPQWYMIMVFFFSVSGTGILGKKKLPVLQTGVEPVTSGY